MAITVRVGKLPGRIQEVVLEDGASKVSDALRAAELDASGFEVRVNNTTRDTNHSLGTGDLVLLVKQIKGNDGHITIRVGKLPGRIEEIALNGSRKVSDALAAVGLSAAGFEVRVNNTARDVNYELQEGDLVLLVKQIKGNDGHITVRVGKLPGRIQEIALNGDRKVSTALTAAGLDASGFEIRVNNTTRDVNHELREGDLVLLVKQIKGNELA